MALGTSLPARIPSSSGASTVYVSPSGNDTTGSGTFASPWATPNKAFESVGTTGGLIYCRGGTYNLTSTQTWSRTGNSSNPVQIRAYPSETPLFTGNHRWHITGKYLRIGPGLEWSSAGSSGALIKVTWVDGTTFAQNIEIQGIKMTILNAASVQGILMTGESPAVGPLQIWDSEFIGNGGNTNQNHQIYLAATLSGTSVVANSIFRDTDVTGGYGLQLYPNADGAIVTCCVFKNITNRSGIVLGGDLGDSTDNARIIGSLFYDINDRPIRILWEGVVGSGNNATDLIGYLNADLFDTLDAGVTWTNILEDTDPLFVNPASNDFHITNQSSPAKALVPSSREGYIPTFDKDGNPRYAGDAGAYAISTASTSNTTRDIRLTGTNASNDSRDARLTGQALSNTTKDVRITGTGQNSNTTRDARLIGAAISNTTRDLRIGGGTATNTTRDIRITGSNVTATNTTRDARITGIASANNTTRDIRITGGAANASFTIRDIRLTGDPAPILPSLVGVGQDMFWWTAANDSILINGSDTPIEIDPPGDYQWAL